MKKVAILQSNYIPWRGYFDLIASVDEFIFYDDMQFTRRDWRNRNLIKTPQGLKWLTVPVQVKGKYFQSIRDTKIQGTDWKLNHWKSIETNYRKAKYFDEISKLIKPLYLIQEVNKISTLNQNFIYEILSYLKINTQISNSWDYPSFEGKTERLANICLAAGGTEYVSGPSAKNYIDEKVFRNLGLSLKWFNYDNYLEYPQLWGKFEPNVSILDMLFNCGPDSRNFLRH